MTDREYVYRVTEVVKVTDGDTYWVRVDPGFRETILVNLRLLGYDCPERTKGTAHERAEAKRAALVAATWLGASDGIWVRTEKDPDDFGRWLGEVWDSTGHLGDALRREGLASLWPQRWRQEFHPG